MSDKREFHNALTDLEAALSATGFRYAVIGGAAVIMRGYDRATHDVDAVVIKAGDRLNELAGVLQAYGFEFREPGGLEFAKRNRVLLLVSKDATAVDISMGYLLFEQEVVDRSTREDIGAGLFVPFATAEDLIIMKIVAMRDRDKDDVWRLLELYPDVDRQRFGPLPRPSRRSWSSRKSPSF